MRKLIESTYLTLDDVMSLHGDMAQRWHFPFFTDQLAIGHRRTGLRRPHEPPPQYVVSTTLATADWTRHPAGQQANSDQCEEVPASPVA